MTHIREEEEDCLLLTYVLWTSDPKSVDVCKVVTTTWIACVYVCQVKVSVLNYLDGLSSDVSVTVCVCVCVCQVKVSVLNYLDGLSADVSVTVCVCVR